MFMKIACHEGFESSRNHSTTFVAMFDILAIGKKETPTHDTHDTAVDGCFDVLSACKCS